MSHLDMEAMTAAFQAHTAGSPKFTRRMAINLADFDGPTPKQLVLRLERLGLVMLGSWEWFEMNGGITRAQVAEVRACSAPTGAAADGGRG